MMRSLERRRGGTATTNRIRFMFCTFSRTAVACALLILPVAATAQEVLDPPPGMVVPDGAAPAADPAAEGDVVVARIGATEIRLTQVVSDMYSLPDEEREKRPFDDLYEELLQHRIDRALVLQAAEAVGLRQKPEHIERMAQLETRVLTETFMQNIIRAKVSPKVLQDRYDAYVLDDANRTELRARHILAEDEAEAADLKARLDAGEDFETLAHSLDYPGADRGGDLGFFTNNSMVPEVVATARSLAIGEISAPFKSQFGWHLIKLEESRVADAQPFETVREELFNQISQEIVAEVLDDLRTNVPVERFNRDGTPADTVSAEDAAPPE
jgi:peptidyl-prolyl cis-trans isomerase C